LPPKLSHHFQKIKFQRLSSTRSCE